VRPEVDKKTAAVRVRVRVKVKEDNNTRGVTSGSTTKEIDR
jgi:hypothetical protein